PAAGGRSSARPGVFGFGRQACDAGAGGEESHAGGIGRDPETARRVGRRRRKVNALSDWLSQPLAHRLGWALVHSLWQGVLAAALFGLLRTVLRRRSAQARYVAGCVVLLALALAPVVTFLTLPGQASDSTGTGLSRAQASSQSK